MLDDGVLEIEIHEELFNPPYLPMLEEQTPMQIFFGGSSSGKSVFLVQRAVYDLLQGRRNYLIVREVGRTLRGSVMNEVKKCIKLWGLVDEFKINESFGTVTCKSNGYQIMFSGLDDVEKLKSVTPAEGVITDIWIEEATEIEYASLKQLEKRLRGGEESISKRLILSFNPILKDHWIYEKYFSSIAWADDQTFFKDDNVVILKTTYKDNKFLTKQDRERLESESDKYWHDVYVLGNWGILSGVIFENVSIEDLSGMTSQFVNHRNGLDFGFAQDPAAVPVMHYDKSRKTLYIYKEFYEQGLTNDTLAQEIKNLIGTRLIVCDSAEPKSIQELRNLGVEARPALKGPDSIRFGIQFLQQLRIVIDKKCTNAKREFQSYHWKTDRSGHVVKVPVDRDNHLIDAARYALESDASDFEPAWEREDSKVDNFQSRWV
jgi:phage terminase large subunit